jgi:hypothetical protein
LRLITPWVPQKFFIPWVFASFALLFYGGMVSIINGMLYKIIPFLSWFHLANKGIFEVPSIKQFLTDGQIRLQFFIHLAVTILIVFLPFYAGFMKYICGFGILLSGLMLWINLSASVRLYKRFSN